MNALTRFDTAEGIELVINTQTGEAFATVSGYARMSGRDKSTISRRTKGVATSHVKTAEVETPGGLQGVALIPAELVFEWLLDDNLELARRMGAVGATVYLHQLAGYKVTSEAIAPTRAIKPAELVVDLIKSLEKLDIQLDNPRFKQPLQDLTLNILGVNPTTLPSEEGSPLGWCGVAERAEQLGYPVGLVAQKRSQLGKFVKASKLESKQEYRVCNGTQRPVWVYRVTEELDRAIHQYFTPSY